MASQHCNYSTANRYAASIQIVLLTIQQAFDIRGAYTILQYLWSIQSKLVNFRIHCRYQDANNCGFLETVYSNYIYLDLTSQSVRRTSKICFLPQKASGEIVISIPFHFLLRKKIKVKSKGSLSNSFAQNHSSTSNTASP